MRLENAFSVPAPVEQAWSVLLDVERVAPCLPGAALEGSDGGEFSGTMTVKLGPVTTRYQGTVRIEEADRQARRAVLRARARDARGDGTAAATITTQLAPEGDGTRVEVITDMTLSGPAAQFGRGVMQDVSGRLMREFAVCLAHEMGAGAPPAGDDVQALAGAPARAPAGLDYEDTPVGPLPIGPAGDAALAGAAVRAARDGRRRSADVLDLGAASRAAVARRLLPALAAASAVLALLLWRRSGRRG